MRAIWTPARYETNRPTRKKSRLFLNSSRTVLVPVGPLGIEETLAFPTGVAIPTSNHKNGASVPNTFSTAVVSPVIAWSTGRPHRSTQLHRGLRPVRARGFRRPSARASAGSLDQFGRQIRRIRRKRLLADLKRRKSPKSLSQRTFSISSISATCTPVSTRAPDFRSSRM